MNEMKKYELILQVTSGHSSYNNYPEIWASAAQIEDDGAIRTPRDLSYGDNPGMKDFSAHWIFYTKDSYGGSALESYDHHFKPYTIEREEDALAMARTLGKIKRGLQRIEDEDGAAKTFGQYVARLCKILKIKRVAFSGRHTDTVYLSPGSAAGKIDSMIADIREYHGYGRHASVQQQEDDGRRANEAAHEKLIEEAA